MHREHRKWWSPALGRDMELLVFGARGTPVLVFPTSMGRFYQWEDFGLIGHMSGRIDAGWLQLWCVDSVDGESFYAKSKPPHERVARHFEYERYLLEEVVPAIRAANEVPYLIATGASFGASHVAMLVTRHPGVVNKAICLSGAYEMKRFLDGWCEGDGYFVDPLAFLPGLTDGRILARLQETEVIVATGEYDRNVDDSRRLVALLQEKGVPAGLHLWNGWAHDWPYWREMVDAFL
ncbi:MAG: esterase family protein [Chloroflexi bacterium]|nr:esterase family protein [Chloroflexota bacterium]